MKDTSDWVHENFQLMERVKRSGPRRIMAFETQRALKFQNRTSGPLRPGDLLRNAMDTTPTEQYFPGRHADNGARRKQILQHAPRRAVPALVVQRHHDGPVGEVEI